MIIQLVFALLAGVLTIAAPCILPMLPILLGASLGQSGKKRPYFIVLGFVISFTAAALILSFIIESFGLGPNVLRNIAIFFLAVFGVFMVWPKPFELLTLHLSGAINKASQAGSKQGNLGGLLLGLTLGLVWTPCAGPVLGSILTLVATQGSTIKSVLLMLAYALGAGIPMLIIAYGSQYITTKVRSIARYTTILQQIFGVLIFALAIAMFFQLDILIESKLVSGSPAVGSSFEQTLAHFAGLYKNPSMPDKLITTAGQLPQNNSDDGKKLITKVELQNYGPAPEFSGIDKWLNLPDGKQILTLADLKGKVVLIDFWTYSCINCIRTLPYVTKWYDTYKDKGLVVVGVHTPEFAFERITENVQKAIYQFGIHYPVAQDNLYHTWQAYNNQYWPAEYLIDQNGNIVYEHFGEGEYDHTENAIRQLLSMDATVAPDNGQDLSGINSPEMYFEPSRLENLSPFQKPSAQPQDYQLPDKLDLNDFALQGNWQFNQDSAELIKGPGIIRLKYHSKNVYMVASSDKPITITIRLDGDKAKEFTVQASQLYELIKSDVSAEHTIDIIIPEAGFKAFTFTFG